MTDCRPTTLALIAALAGSGTTTAAASVADDVKAVLDAWGTNDQAVDRNADGRIGMGDLLLAVTGDRIDDGRSVLELLGSSGGTTFLRLQCDPYVGEGWQANGYAGLATYRVYAHFQPSDPEAGVVAVFGLDEQSMTMSSSNGAFHNDLAYGGLTAPADGRSSGIWSNQWDTYITLNATDANGDETVVSPTLGANTDDLSRNFTLVNDGWFATPNTPQVRAVDGRVLVGQFSAAEGVELNGSWNLLLRDDLVILDERFYCAGGGVDLGACCIDDASDCRTVSETYCASLDGVFFGVGTECVRQIVDTPCHPGASGQHCVRVLSSCPEEGAARGECEPGPFLDAWISPEDDGSGEASFHDFGSLGQAIPADFFAFGSDPLTTIVTLESAPLGGEFGDADTLIRRSEDPFDRCALPSADEVIVEAEVFFLSLKSSAPVRVTYLGGQHEEFWNVHVALSLDRPEPGTLRAVKTSCNGGTYSVENLRVQSQFTFSRVQDPTDIRVFDTGVQGLEPTILSLEEGRWVSDVDPGIVVFNPYCTDFRPGLLDDNPPRNCDCNDNLLRDLCDIEAGESLDCNEDAVPDECEIAEGAADCNKNGILDSCECPGDVVGDCNVGFADVLAVIGSWGPCGGCIEDVTRDGLVGYADILEILRTWGPCGSE